MKKYNRYIALALAILACVIAPLAVAEEAKEYLYENKYLWTVPTDSFTWDAYYSLYDHHKGMGRDAFDGTVYSIDDIVNSPLGESMVANIENFLLYPDEQDPAVYAYWESKGIKKVLHDADDPDRKWSSFIALDADKPENAEKKYAVLFVFHGNNNPIYFIESWGYPNFVAEEDLIVVMPWAKNGGKTGDENEGVFLTQEVDRIMDVLRASYNLDESRIYATGFSLGGRSTVNQVMKHPNMFAAIAVGGQHTYGVGIVEEEFAALKETPIMVIAGNCDRNHHFPYGQKNETVTEALNRWFQVNGIDDSYTMERNLDLATNSDNIVEKNLGLSADEMYVQYYDGRAYYTGEWFNDEGVNMVQAVAIEGLPHWLSGSFPNVVWNFLKQYARDTETGELIVLNQDNEPQLIPEEIDYNKEGTFIDAFTTEVAADGEIVINLRASADIVEIALTDEEGNAIAMASCEKVLDEDGYYAWTIKTSLEKPGRQLINLIPTSDKYGVKKTLKVPVKVL